MQLGAVLVFDAGPLQLRSGGIDVERLRAYTAERLSLVPRTRQRRVEAGLGRPAFFADDPSFQLDYHVRHASLPRPGDERALKRLAGRVLSQALDPDKPLWELWVVEGLDEDRFALIARLDSALLEEDEPRGVLSGVSGLLRDALGAVAHSVLRGPPLASSHSRIDWLALDAADVAGACGRLGVLESDLALAALAGGFRRLSQRRGTVPAALTALTPTCVASGRPAPRIRLPVDEADPQSRLDRLQAARERIAPAPPPAIPLGRSPLASLTELARVAAEGAPADVVFAELAVNGALLLGATLRAVVPVLPRAGGGLGVTATRVGERIFLALAADAVSMPDLSALADGVAASFDELRRLAAAEPKPTPVRRARARRRTARSPRAEPEVR